MLLKFKDLEDYGPFPVLGAKTSVHTHSPQLYISVFFHMQSDRVVGVTGDCETVGAGGPTADDHIPVPR